MRDYLAQIWKCRYFWMSLVKMDLRTRYRRSFLGIGWSLLQPLAMSLVLCVVFHKLLDVEVRDYGPFLLAGLTFWNYFTTAILQGCLCFYQGEAYIRQHPVPLAIYPLRTALGGAVHFGMALLVVLVMTWTLRGFGNLASLLSLVPTLGLLLVLGWSLAIIAGLASVYFPDLRHLLEIGLQLLFYATPIMYPPNMLRARGLGWFVDYNPISTLVDLVRTPILEGTIPPASSFALATAIVLASALTAIVALAGCQRKLIFHL